MPIVETQINPVRLTGRLIFNLFIRLWKNCYNMRLMPAIIAVYEDQVGLRDGS